MTDPASADDGSAEELGTEQGRRIIQLLWEPSASAVPSRGPKPKITLDDVIDAGVAMADADGLANLSMRKVAGRLGVGAMSLYTYVPGRDELLELMVNRVHAELAPDAGEPPADELSWREDVEHQVGERWRMYERHPWLLDLNAARSPVGPHVLDADEALYAALHRAGLRGTEVVSTSNLILWQLLGAARSQIIDSDLARRTGTSAEAYWDSRASFWTTYFDYGRYPTMAAVWESGGFDDDQAYAFDRLLARLLDALEASLPGR